MANIKDLYKELVKTFLIENNIKEVICKDIKEHFFDKIIVTDKENRIIKVYIDGLKDITFSNLLFNFSPKTETSHYSVSKNHLISVTDIWLHHG